MKGKNSPGNYCQCEYKSYYLNKGAGMLKYNTSLFGHYPKLQPDL